MTKLKNLLCRNSKILNEKFWELLYKCLIAVQISATTAYAQSKVSSADFNDINPFELFLCPIIGLIRNYGIAVVIIFTVIIGILVYLADKGGEDKGIMSVIKTAGVVVVGIGILLLLYFLFEDWIISSFGFALCASEIG